MSPTKETEVEVKPKRVRAKRAPKIVSDDAVETPLIKRAPRKASAPRKRTPNKEEAIAEPEDKRKAPTPIAGEKATKRKGRKQIIVVTILMVLGVGTSAVVGLTDVGGIDVNHVIESRNDRIRRGEIQDTIVPVQNTNTEPDGGLIPLTPEEAAKYAEAEKAKTAATEVTASSTASSTPVGNVPPSPEEAAAAAAAADQATE